MAALAPSLRTVYPAHGDSPMSPALLPEMREAVEQVAAGVNRRRSRTGWRTTSSPVSPCWWRRRGDEDRSFGVRLLAYVLAAAVGALLVGSISAQRLVAYESRAAIFLFALLLGLINATIKPVLQLLTLPLTCLTFGLFALLLNAALFGLAAWLTPGMQVSFWGAILGAIVASIASCAIYSLLDER